LRRPELPAVSYGQMFKENVWLGLVILVGMIGGALHF
jgi:4-hydroxybenzoate polyprenyltransferase